MVENGGRGEWGNEVSCGEEKNVGQRSLSPFGRTLFGRTALSVCWVRIKIWKPNLSSPHEIPLFLTFVSSSTDTIEKLEEC